MVNWFVGSFIENHRKQILLILISSFLWTALAQFDPFGVKTAANIQSESIFMRLVGGPWYQSAAQDKITVILIDNNYLEEFGEEWPMSYVAHSFS